MRSSVALLALLSLGCSSTIAGTFGDASSPDVVDAAPPMNFELAVLLDLNAPGAPGVDVPVSVVPRGGAPIEASTGSDGVLRLALDPTLTYDVTAAEVDHVAVSLIGLRVPVQTRVRLPRTTPVAATGIARATATVSITGRTAPRSAVILEGSSGSTVARDDSVLLSIPRWNGAPDGIWLSATELDDASHMRRGGALYVPSRASPGSPRIALGELPTRDMSRVEFPFVGRVTPSTFGSAEPGQVIRFKPSEYGEGVAPVGESTLDTPDAIGNAEWNITHFTGPLAPELTWVRYTTRDGALTGTVSLQPAFAGLIPAVPPVEALSAEARGAGRFAFTAAVGSWTRAYFEITNLDGTARWRGYAIGTAPWDALSLPPLPSRIAPSRVFGSAPVVARACVVHDAPQMGQLPWWHTRPVLPFWTRLSVCATSPRTDPPR